MALDASLLSHSFELPTTLPTAGAIHPADISWIASDAGISNFHTICYYPTQDVDRFGSETNVPVC